jgi:hypothetical protein
MPFAFPPESMFAFTGIPTERRIHRFSASMRNFAGVVGSLATGRRGSRGEVIGRYAATLFGSLILRKPGNIG